jgi:uncharacterized membrane protein YphA (DoxX/SURF4 family)
LDSLICLSSQCPHAWLATLDVVRLCMAAFLAILFLQSGLDKVVDRKGNVEWLTSHFANSPLASQVVPMLGVITVVEVSAGALSALGFLALLFTGSAKLAAWGAIVSLVALLMLFFGQRMAKDYEGAAVLVPYFLVSSAALWLMGT